MLTGARLFFKNQIVTLLSAEDGPHRLSGQQPPFAFPCNAANPLSSNAQRFFHTTCDRNNGRAVCPKRDRLYVLRQMVRREMGIS